MCLQLSSTLFERGLLWHLDRRRIIPDKHERGHASSPMKNIPSGIDLLLISAGVALLIVGAYLAYPYIHSRVARPVPTAAAPDASMEPRIDSIPTHDATEPAPTEPALQSPTATSETPPLPSPVVLDATIPSLTTEAEPQPRDRPGAPPTRIVLPALGVDAPVVPVSRQETQVEGETRAVWGVPDTYAAGWHDTSALLGERGNTVLNGHNTNNGEVFRDLYKLKVDDEVILYSGDISVTYRVSETLILPEAGQPLGVRLANARYAMPTEDRRLTLVTCHPYGSLRNRLIVIARPAAASVAPEPPED